MVLKTNRDIKSVEDLKDKVIGAQAFSDFAGAQAQFYVMKNQGLDYIMDPKQVIFTGNSDETIQGILDGRWDVGFVRTGQVERTVNPATGEFIDPSVFKVLDPRIHVMDRGELFPFLHSTPVFPEWTLSAKDNVDRFVTEEVTEAMINFEYHNSIGDSIHNCREDATTPEAMNLCDTMPPVYFDSRARCDTTRELAELAWQAGVAGFHNGFRPPRSYYFVRTMQQDGGFIEKDEYGNSRCKRAGLLYDGLTCPDGHYKIREEDFKKQCTDAGTPCPEGYHCYCKPCIKAFDVSIFPVSIDSEFNRDNGCQKMGLCGEIGQTKPIRLQARDNLERENVEVTALVRLGRDARYVSVTEVEKYLYEFEVSHQATGFAIVEVYIDAFQIPESPIRVEITARDCDVDFPDDGKGRIPNAVGICECPPGTVEVQDSCVSTDTFEVSITPWIVNGIEVQLNASEITGCEKMGLCGSVEQTREIRLYAFDNRLRDNATLAVLMHIGQNVRELPIRQVEPYLYEFSVSNSRLGVAILEILVNGVQIRESPIRVEISPRDCNVEYPHQNKVPNSDGGCVCSTDTIKIAGDCVPLDTFSAIMACVALLIALTLGWCFLSYKRRKNDEMWQVSPEELNFSHPVEIIGQGAFGVVLAAEYRGTKVAIKRVVARDPSKATLVSPANDSENPPPTVSSEKVDHNDPETGCVDSPNTRATDVPVSSAGKSSDDSSTTAFFDDFDIGAKQTMFQRWMPSILRGRDVAVRSNIHLLGTVSGSGTKKTLHARLLPWCDETIRRQKEFMTEMRLLSRLRHPCITTIMGAVMTGVEPMMVMEYMDNGSLYDLLRNETMYTGGEIIMQICRDVAQGIRFLHASKPPILHRDLKAKNILIDSRFRAKVADFGLSTKNKSGLSGTPFWMAPEYLLRRTEYTTACDIYAFGMILFEIYSRQIPYEGENPRKVLRKICDPRINYRPNMPGTCPKRMADIMRKCWSNNVSFRPDAKDLDTLFIDITASDAEPLMDQGNTRLRTEVAAGDMLYQVFPKKVADQLKAGQKVEPETHDNVTVFFSDIVRFTDISRVMSPSKVCDMLDRLYLAFDALSKKHEVFKVETIGDAWVGVTNLDDNQSNSHVKRIAEFAVDAVTAAGNVLIDVDDPGAGCVRIRVGFHSGPVVSNVIGSLNPRYGLFGDTMNTASRMENLSFSDRIQCSESSAMLLKEQAPGFPLRKRGKVAVKGKGQMLTYWVGERSSGNQDVTGVSRSFNDNPVAGLKNASKCEGKRPVVQGRLRPSTMNTGTITTSAFHNDASDSAPLSGPKLRPNQNKSRWISSGSNPALDSKEDATNTRSDGSLQRLCHQLTLIHEQDMKPRESCGRTRGKPALQDSITDFGRQDQDEYGNLRKQLHSFRHDGRSAIMRDALLQERDVRV
eukprot:scaffold1172_cov115-Cylindrotheca_fusiformis.AAC.2